MSRQRREVRRKRAQRSWGSWRTIAVAAAIAIAAPAAAFAAWLFFAGSGGSEERSGPPKAVIVDQLSLTAPNPEFGTQARQMLERAGYVVDYVPGEQVTVDYYRNLPSSGYELVLMRAHAAGRDFAAEEYGEDVSIFTSERVSADKYIEEQQARLLKGVFFSERDMEEGRLYFGIPPDFVQYRMRGEFDGATVVLMGCDVLRAQAMAKAFVERGAGAVVGWDKAVTASHTDAATLSLLRHMLDDGLSAEKAAEAAMAEVGPDPVYDAKFLSYSP